MRIFFLFGNVVSILQVNNCSTFKKRFSYSLLNIKELFLCCRLLCKPVFSLPKLRKIHTTSFSFESLSLLHKLMECITTLKRNWPLSELTLVTITSCIIHNLKVAESVAWFLLQLSGTYRIIKFRIWNRFLLPIISLSHVEGVNCVTALVFQLKRSWIEHVAKCQAFLWKKKRWTSNTTEERLLGHGVCRQFCKLRQCYMSDSMKQWTLDNTVCDEFYWEMAPLVFRHCMAFGNGNVEYHKLTQEISSQADINAFNCGNPFLYPLSIYVHLWTQASVPYSKQLDQPSLTIAVLDSF